MTAQPPCRTTVIEDLDGERLLVRDWGPDDAAAVVYHHGTPASSLDVPAGWTDCSRHGARVITFDRPGYGGSVHRPPGRSVARAADWTARIADHLGLDRFAVMGTSGGGPYAAATAAVLGERVNRLAISVGAGPVGLPGFDAADGMLPETAAEIRAAVAGEETLQAFIDAEMAQAVPLDTWYRQLPPKDVEILGRPDVVAEEAAGAEVMFAAQATTGWREDDLAIFARPWECDLSSITARTLLVYGAADVLVPAWHGTAYRVAIGHGQLVVVPGTGHWMRDVEGAVLRWLVATDDAPADLSTSSS